MSTVLEREEYIEQVYFFHVFRERLALNLAAQDLLNSLHEEILSTTRLPMAIQFLATEMKHSGLLSSGMERLSHYFTPFQVFVIQQTEAEKTRFNMETALLVLEREAQYRAGQPIPAGLFVYQFEAISRNRLGYDEGLHSMAGDPLYNQDWREFLEWVRRQVGVVDFGDMVHWRSQLFVKEQRRKNPAYESPLPILFDEKEGRIAHANTGRDPLFMFAALQRQLNYPEVPRPRQRDDLSAKFEVLQAKFREMEQRFKLIEGELRGNIDLTQLGKPEWMEEGEENDKMTR